MRPASDLMSLTTPGNCRCRLPRGRLHRRVERKRVGLRRDFGDRAQDRIDLAARAARGPRRLPKPTAPPSLLSAMTSAGLPDPVHGLGDRRAEPLGRRAHRRDIRHRVLRDERRLDRLAFGHRRHARKLARGLVHGLDAVRDAEQHRAHDAVEPADRILQRLAALLHALRMRDIGAQPVALLQRALQHG